MGDHESNEAAFGDRSYSSRSEVDAAYRARGLPGDGTPRPIFTGEVGKMTIDEIRDQAEARRNGPDDPQRYAPKLEFAVGDLVRLKSGGPVMTITGKGSNVEVAYNVAWFDGSGKLCRDYMHACSVVSASAPTSA